MLYNKNVHGPATIERDRKDASIFPVLEAECEPSVLAVTQPSTPCDALLPLAGASAVYAEQTDPTVLAGSACLITAHLFNADVLTDIGQVALGRTPTALIF